MSIWLVAFWGKGTPEMSTSKWPKGKQNGEKARKSPHKEVRVKGNKVYYKDYNESML